MNFLQDLFQEVSGKWSLIRILSLGAFVTAIVGAFAGIGIEYVIPFIVAAFVPKAVQKFAEKELPTRKKK